MPVNIIYLNQLERLVRDLYRRKENVTALERECRKRVQQRYLWGWHDRRETLLQVALRHPPRLSPSSSPSPQAVGCDLADWAARVWSNADPHIEGLFPPQAWATLLQAHVPAKYQCTRIARAFRKTSHSLSRLLNLLPRSNFRRRTFNSSFSLLLSALKMPIVLP
jgi:hypothetical protein